MRVTVFRVSFHCRWPVIHSCLASYRRSAQTLVLVVVATGVARVRVCVGAAGCGRPGRAAVIEGRRITSLSRPFVGGSAEEPATSVPLCAAGAEHESMWAMSRHCRPERGSHALPVYACPSVREP